MFGRKNIEKGLQAGKPGTGSGLSRRKFLKMALLSATGIYCGGTLLDRMAKEKNGSGPLTVKSMEDIDPRPYSNNIKSIRLVKAETKAGQCELVFVGVEHNISEAKKDATAIGNLIEYPPAALPEHWRPSIVCTEYVVGRNREKYLPVFDAETYRHGPYFGRVVAKANGLGIPAAIIEGYRPTDHDYLAPLSFSSLTLYGMAKLAAKIHRGLLFLGLIAALDMFHVLADEYRNPIILQQRNCFYGAAIRRVIEEGHRRLIIVTGEAHVDGTITELKSDALPSSDAFAKEIGIVHPDDRLEKLKLK